jgi:uncharacterized protein (DUF1330 family)
MAVTLCVSLWAAPGNEGLLVAYEDQVLALLRAHNGRLLQRVRTVDGDADDPFEVHVIEFADQASFDAYMTDPRRVALAELRDRALAPTQVLRVEVV